MQPKLTNILLASAVTTALLTSGCAHGKVASTSEEVVTTASTMPSDAELRELLVSFDVPGLAMATLTNCAVDDVRIIGTADLESGAPVTPVTAFEAASLSKPLFAYLVLQLADEGLIDLDAPMAPFSYPRITDEAAFAQLTPRMVLTHRTGLPNWSGDSQQEDRTDPVLFEAPPGTRYSYSGEAFELLRAYVVDRTGLSLQQLFEQRLGALMPSSSFDGRLVGEATVSRVYISASGDGSGRDLYLEPHETGAAWGLVTTAGDYAAFLSEVCRAETLSPELHADMLTPQSPLPDGQSIAPSSMGLGWIIVQLGSETIAMHEGNNDEYRSLAAYLPETGEGYVLLTNGRNGAELIMALMQEQNE